MNFNYLSVRRILSRVGGTVDEGEVVVVVVVV